MSIKTSLIKLVDQPSDVFSITIQNDLLSANAELLRKAIEECSHSEYENIYLNLGEVVKIDLTGINEIIQTHTTLQSVFKKLTIVYRKDSEVEKWIEKSGVDKFITIAILPAI